MSNLQRNLAYLCEARGGNLKALSTAAGLGSTAIRDIIKGRSSNPRGDTLQKLADLFGTGVEDLLHRDLAADGAGGDNPSGHDALDLPQTPPRLPPRDAMPRDVPVYGTAAAAVTGAMQMIDDIVDYVRRPPGIVGAKDVYGLYVLGDSMEPRYSPGDIVYVHPHRPVRLGDYVVVQTRDYETAPVQVYIKRLLQRTANHLDLGWLNPPDTVTQIPIGCVVAMHKVLTVNELFGV